MEQNNTSTVVSLTKYSSTTSSSFANVGELFDHWAWDFYVYTFACLFGILAVSCFVAFIQQRKQLPNSPNIYGRFTTVQLFIAATLKVVGLLCIPISLHDASPEMFAGSLIIDSLSSALTQSAFSILLLILLETTKTSLGAPRLQNIWVLLGITAVFTTTVLAFNLFVLYGDRQLGFFISHLIIFVWGITICAGYAVAGYRMWRNLKSSRRIGNSTRKGRLQTIISQVFMSAVISAVTLTLNLVWATNDYGFVNDDPEITKEGMWSGYPILFLIETCEFAIMVLIFAIVIKTKTRSSSVENGQVVQLGTFTEDNTTKYEEEPKD